MIRKGERRPISEPDFKILADIIDESASACTECESKLVDFCLEECCSATPVFCRQCSTDHLAHRTNSLLRLFSHPTTDAGNAELLKQLEANEITIIPRGGASSDHLNCAKAPLITVKVSNTDRGDSQ